MILYYIVLCYILYHINKFYFVSHCIASNPPDASPRRDNGSSSHLRCVCKAQRPAFVLTAHLVDIHLGPDNIM